MQIECFFHLVRKNMLWKSKTAQNLNTDQCIKTIFLPVKKVVWVMATKIMIPDSLD